MHVQLLEFFVWTIRWHVDRFRDARVDARRHGGHHLHLRQRAHLQGGDESGTGHRLRPLAFAIQPHRVVLDPVFPDPPVRQPPAPRESPCVGGLDAAARVVRKGQADGAGGRDRQQVRVAHAVRANQRLQRIRKTGGEGARAEVGIGLEERKGTPLAGEFARCGVGRVPQGPGDALRRIAFYDTERQQRLVFITNNFALPALTITQLYKCRWQIELFFKWIKQHLRIKAFYGTTDNAVKTQIWIAISVYVLVAIVKKELRLERSLYEILQVLSITLFEKTPLFQALTTSKLPDSNTRFPNQLTLFVLAPAI